MMRKRNADHPRKGELQEFLRQSVKNHKDSHACLVWPFCTNDVHYGMITIKQRRFYTHRLAYQWFVADITLGKRILHKCDNPPCFNPKHLYEGTQADNIADCIAKGRFHRGENTGGAKLTATKVKQIRRILAESTKSREEIGERFGVTRATINDIALGKTWAHV
jgi:hypothetical protein